MTYNLIMLGPPGVGKGTQAERFAREHRVPKISTGDILREAVHDETPLGPIAKETMEAGQLVSDDVMIAIVRERLGRPDTANGFVLDGFPRTVAQAEALDAIMHGRGELIIVNMVVPHEELVRRLSSRRICSHCGHGAEIFDGEAPAACSRCGGPLVPRSDDGEEVVSARLKVYERETQPLVEYYRDRATFRTINGDQPPDRVAGDLRAAVQAAAVA